MSELVKSSICQMDSELCSDYFSGRVCLPGSLSRDPTVWLFGARTSPISLIMYLTNMHLYQLGPSHSKAVMLHLRYDFGLQHSLLKSNASSILISSLVYCFVVKARSLPYSKTPEICFIWVGSGYLKLEHPL